MTCAWCGGWAPYFSVVDGFGGLVILLVYRYHQHHVCKVTGKW